MNDGMDLHPEYSRKLMNRALTADEFAVAEQAVKGATEAGIHVNAGNVMKVFPPGVRNLVRRYLRGY
jgi:hypothetical protein